MTKSTAFDTGSACSRYGPSLCPGDIPATGNARRAARRAILTAIRLARRISSRVLRGHAAGVSGVSTRSASALTDPSPF